MLKFASISLLSLLALTPINGSLLYYSEKVDDSESLVFKPTDIQTIKSIKCNHSLWVRDCLKQDLKEHHFFLIDKVLADGHTPYQSYTIVNTELYGKMLLIDGEIQSCEEDEQIYHESLIHPAMVSHSNPESVLVIGAGEGATAREILRHPSVKRVVLVDIDGEIIQNVKEHLVEWHRGSFDDPKVELLITDGKKFVEETNEKFDVIVIDVCDKLDDSPASALYNAEFYRAVQSHLKPSGKLVVQAMEFATSGNTDHVSIQDNLKKVFKSVSSYSVFVPSFWTSWGFTIATDDLDFAKLTPQKIDDVLDQRKLTSQLQHYDGQTHVHMFALPKGIR